MLELFAIVKISDIFSAYFFVNFCLKIWKNYTRWKKSQNFTVIFTIANFFEKFCPFFGEKFCTVQKKITFFYAKYCRKIFNAKITAKNCKKNYEKINGKHFNLLSPKSSNQLFARYISEDLCGGTSSVQLFARYPHNNNVGG